MMPVWPLGERKARVGQATRLVWQSPAPVRLATVPTATLHLPSGPVAIVLSPAGGTAGEVEVTAIDARDSSLLTTDFTFAPAGELGSAWLITGGSGGFKVHVTDVPTATTARLAEELTRTVAIGAETMLVSAVWVGTIPAQAAPVRNVRLSVAYSVDGFTETEDSIVHFVRSPFTTGATTTDLRNHARDLGGEASATQGLENALAYGERETALMARQQLRAQGLTEDAVRNGAAFRLVCLYLAAASLLDRVDVERAKAQRDRAGEELMLAMESVSLDTDDDLKPDTEQQVTGVRPAWGAQHGVAPSPTRHPLRNWGL